MGKDKGSVLVMIYRCDNCNRTFQDIESSDSRCPECNTPYSLMLDAIYRKEPDGTKVQIWPLGGS